MRPPVATARSLAASVSWGRITAMLCTAVVARQTMQNGALPAFERDRARADHAQAAAIILHELEQLSESGTLARIGAMLSGGRP